MLTERDFFEIGDEVTFLFCGEDPLTGIICHIPDTEYLDDLWKVQTKDYLYAISNFQAMFKKTSPPDLDLSVRVKNILKSYGIETASNIEQLTDFDLLRMDGMGKKSFDEVKSFVNEFKRTRL